MPKKKQDQPVTLKTLGEFTEEVLLPGMEKLVEPLEERMDGLEGRMDRLEGRMDRLEGTVSKLPDKDYLDRKLAELRGDIILRRLNNFSVIQRIVPRCSALKTSLSRKNAEYYAEVR